ncbi:hypothetical protein [Turicibacter sanguinis]|uniref:hypothetical protein n=1 Tax=Turicibacter sanguinis TaxID=154288 RepID=UPI0018A8D55C|nr:hypothetical protein [Turicibacter sanguinis]MDB8553810.1 hypothetical protein [Turicibacter sanguinis]
MSKGYVVGYVDVYVTCSSNDGVLVGSTDVERAKFVLENQYLSNVADGVIADYWIEVYYGKNIIGIIDFNKETLGFSSQFIEN